MDWVVNTTVISNFAATGCLDLLRAVLDPLYLPVEVYDEICAGRLAGYTFYKDIEEQIVPYSTKGWLHLISMSQEELELFTNLPSTLHKGEGAALSIARTRAWGCLTDDQAARRQARLWNVPLSGTIGVLLSAVEDQLFAVEEANKILRSMIIKAHYRSPINDLSRLL